MIYTRTQEVFKRLFDMKNGANSRVVLERQKEISKLESDAARILEEVDAANRETASLQSTLKALTKQYESLKELIKGKKTIDYEELNKELQISFDPTALRKELEEKYPNKKLELSEKITNFENEVKIKNEEVTKLRSEVEEKSLQMSTILEKQKEMVELLKKSASGDLLNFSPRPIIDTLKFLNFNDDEAKMLASNLIFSNPDFVSYYKSLEEAELEKKRKEKEEIIATQVEEPEEKIVLEEPKEEFATEVIDVFKEEPKVEVQEEKEDYSELVKREFNATDEDLLEYKELLNDSVQEKINKLKEAYIDLNVLSLAVLDNVDNFIANYKLLNSNEILSNDDLVKYSTKLTYLPNSKLEKYINEYHVVYHYPQGNLYMGVFDIDENIVSANANGLVKVDSHFFTQYPQFQVSICDNIADIIHTCILNQIDYQDEENNYYMFVFDTKEFINLYPDIKIVSYKGLGE